MNHIKNGYDLSYFLIRCNIGNLQHNFMFFYRILMYKLDTVKDSIFTPGGGAKPIWRTYLKHHVVMELKAEKKHDFMID